LVAAFARHPPPSAVPALPSEDMPACRPSLHVGHGRRSRLPSRDAVVVANAPGPVTARADVTSRPIQTSQPRLIDGNARRLGIPRSPADRLAGLDRAGVGPVVGLGVLQDGGRGQGTASAGADSIRVEMRRRARQVSRSRAELSTWWRTGGL